MEIGIIDYLLRTEESVAFEAAAQAECQSIDWSVDQPDDASKLLADYDRMSRVMERMRSTGVRIRALYATCFLRVSLTTDEAPIRTRAFETLREIAVLAGNLGVPTVIVPLFGASEATWADDLPKLQRIVTTTAKIAASHNVRFAFKTILPAEAMLAIIAETGSERLGICVDPANCIPLGRDPLAEIRAAARALFHVHLKDRDRLGECRELGGGELDLAAVAAELRIVGYAGPIVLETQSGDSPIEAARNNAQFLRELLA